MQRKNMTRNERKSHSLWCKALSVVCAGLMILLAACMLTLPARSEESEEDITQNDFHETESAETPAIPEVQEDFENEKIEVALLENAVCIEDCTVTWYTADTCGKKPGDPAYGITYSGLPAVEHLTCAVDPKVIPLYSDVFVQYADGTVEQLWATDTGIHGHSLDIYEPDYDMCVKNGRQHLTVWYVPPMTV